MLRKAKLLIPTLGVLAILTATTFIKAPETKAFGGGDGTRANPYLISTCQELQDINNDVAKSYALTSDVDCSMSSSWNVGTGFVPIGSELSGSTLAEVGFTGSLDGRGYTISDLYIERAVSFHGRAGLFSYTSGASIYNTHLNNLSVSGREETGGLVGEARVTKVRGVSVQGAINCVGSADCGGLIGRLDSYGVVQDSTATISMQIMDGSDGTFGGLVGRAVSDGVEITRSYAAGSIVDSSNASSLPIGGLVGAHESGEGTTHSFASVSISSSSQNVGGLFGLDSSDNGATNYFDATVAGISDCSSYHPSSCTIINGDGLDPDYFNNTTINAPLDQWDFSTIWQTTSGLPELRATTIPLGTLQDKPSNIGVNALSSTAIRVNWTPPPLGVLYAIQYRTPSDPNWRYGEVSEENSTSYVLRGLTPVTTYQVRMIALSTEYGSSEPTSDITIATPATAVLPGSGTPTDPYRVSSCQQLQSIDELLASSLSARHASYILTQDIDCSASAAYNVGTGFAPIGSNGEVLASGGRFDGQGHTISGLYINTTNQDDLVYDPYYVGLFRSVNSASIRNLSLIDAQITCGESTYSCGGLVGTADNSSVAGVHVEATISSQYANGYMGLLAGYYNTGILIKSSTSGAIQAGESGAVGGLVGRIYNTQITDTYSDASITAEPSLISSSLELGGLIGGLDSGIISTSYSSGTISISNPILGYDSVGGLVGTYYGGEIISSFSRSPISYSGDYGGLVGEFWGTSLAGSSYDQTVTTAADCDQDAVTSSCIKVNTDGNDADYYNNNVINSPLDSWDFTSVWQSTSGLPVLRPSPVTSPNPPTNLAATSSGNAVAVSWEPPLNTGGSAITSYILEYKKVGTSTWSAVGTSDTFYNFENLSAATQYAFRVYAFNQDENYSQPSATIFATTNLEGYIAISDCQDLQNIQNDLTANYYLAHNIDCTETISWNDGDGFGPLGESGGDGFVGTILGNGYTIKNLYMHNDLNNEEGLGLFAYAEGANIQDIRFASPTIKARSVSGVPFIGVLGGIINGGSVTNIQVANGVVEGVDQTSAYVGGLVGLGNAPIARSSYTGIVAHGGTLGGLLGGSNGEVEGGLPQISDSYANVAISIMPSGQQQPAFAGGLVGAFGETIESSYATGSITIIPASGQVAQGGIIGFAQGNDRPTAVRDSFSKMSLDESDPLRGGIAGATFVQVLDLTTSYFDATAAGTQSYSYIDIDATSTSNAVNTSGSDPGYFYANNTNPPMNAWDFTDVWQLTELTPTFQTESVLSPVTPGASIAPVAPTAPEGSETGSITPPAADETTQVNAVTDVAPRVTGNSTSVKPADEVGVIGAIKHFVRSLPTVVVVGFPYALFALLGAAALVLLAFLIRELRRLHILEALIHKQQLLAEERDAFWHLAANYLRAPVTLIVGGAEALRESHVTEGTKAIAALAASLQLKVGEIMKKIEGSTSLQAIKGTHEHVAAKVARKAIFIVPLAVVAGLTLFGNYAAASYRNLSPGLAGYATQFAIFVIVSVLFYWVLSLLTRGTAKRKEAEVLLETQTTSLANARHELIEDTAKNLNPDLTRLEGMLKGLPAPMATTAVGALATLHEGSDRLRGIVTSFALLIKVQEGSGSVNAAPGSVDLSGILNKVRSKLTPEITSKGVHVSAPAVPLAVTAESEMAQQVIESIVANAVDYSPTNGTVKVEAKRLQDSIQLRVTDQGKGIDKKQLDHLFQPFVRADGTSAMDMSHGGFGINLYLDKLIMEQMGGSISAASTPGKGTAITMTWPTAP